MSQPNLPALDDRGGRPDKLPPMEPLPAIAMVTPSFNKAPYLEATIQSILGQGYPDLDYVIMDGGSTDGSVDIIRRYADRLAHWQSAPDGGQYAAVTAGFAHTTAPIMGWLNADDQLAPWALGLVGRIFRDCPLVEWITTNLPLETSADGIPTATYPSPGYTRAGFYRGLYLLSDETDGIGFIQQESTFWRRSLWDRAGGGFDPSCRLAGDFELWSRFFRHAELFSIDVPLGLFRRTGDQLSVTHRQRYVDECKAVLRRYGSLGPVDPRYKFDRLARGANLVLEDFRPFYEPVPVVRWNEEQQRYVALFAGP